MLNVDNMTDKEIIAYSKKKAKILISKYFPKCSETDELVLDCVCYAFEKAYKYKKEKGILNTTIINCLIYRYLFWR